VRIHIRRERQRHPDPLGLALSTLSESDQAIIVADAIAYLSDREISRRVRAGWTNPARRINAAHDRLDRAATLVTLDVEADRVRIDIHADDAFETSQTVRDICDHYDLIPDRAGRCAAPGCDRTWTIRQKPGGGRPREVCSEACRQRRRRHRQRAT